MSFKGSGNIFDFNPSGKELCRPKKCKKTLGFPNQGERYGAKYENGVAYLLSYTVSVGKNMDTEYTLLLA
jgi:hypothetical protein